jgi:transaldolase/glucose-6-phosphate isomerase
METPLIALQRLGQSVWLDYIRRDLLTSGELRKLVDEGVVGLTSNPAIFEKAILGSKEYDAGIRQTRISFEAEKPVEIYERLAIEDIQMAADILRPAYDRTAGRDGYVSLEVSPHLAHDTQATIDEARRLRAAVARPNLMIKVPGTPAGVPAIQQLIREGISVNVTLLFAVEAYEAVAQAYIAGLEQRIAAGEPVDRVASVASFFVSRIDTLIDEQLEKAAASTSESSRRARLLGLCGKIAIANAKIAYVRYQELIASKRWQALAARGARPQRLLWASTSTKNPAYPKTIYVDELIGPDTVNTLPPETLDAFRAHGQPRVTLTLGLEEARRQLQELAALGISLQAATDQLLKEAVKKFADPFDKLLKAIDLKRQALVPALA